MCGQRQTQQTLAIPTHLFCSLRHFPLSQYIFAFCFTPVTFTFVALTRENVSYVEIEKWHQDDEFQSVAEIMLFLLCANKYCLEGISKLGMRGWLKSGWHETTMSEILTSADPASLAEPHSDATHCQAKLQKISQPMNTLRLIAAFPEKFKLELVNNRDCGRSTAIYKCLEPGFSSIMVKVAQLDPSNHIATSVEHLPAEIVAMTQLAEALKSNPQLESRSFPTLLGYSRLSKRVQQADSDIARETFVVFMQGRGEKVFSKNIKGPLQAVMFMRDVFKSTSL